MPTNKKSRLTTNLIHRAATGFCLTGSLRGSASYSGVPFETLKSFQRRHPDKWEDAVCAVRESVARNPTDAHALKLAQNSIETITTLAGEAVPELLREVVSSRPRAGKAKISKLETLMRVWIQGMEKQQHLLELKRMAGESNAWHVFQERMATGIIEILKMLPPDILEKRYREGGEHSLLNGPVEVEYFAPDPETGIRPSAKMTGPA